MLQWFTKKIHNRKGFTIIELVVVIAILGILSAIAIPRFAGTQNTANERANEANLAILRSAATLAVAEHGSPTGDVNWTAPGTGTDPHLADNYLETWPEPPTGFGAYTVTIDTTGEVDVTQATP
ncbi:MAG TPA: type II secretion system protein [Clostridia bacterium]|nr:type II secretion system protein [Clostridia bacterium]